MFVIKPLVKGLLCSLYFQNPLLTSNSLAKKLGTANKIYPKRVGKILIKAKVSEIIFNPLSDKVVQRKTPKHTPQAAKNAPLIFVLEHRQKIHGQTKCL